MTKTNKLIAPPNLALKQVRKATGLNQIQFALAVGVEGSFVNTVEHGKRKASSKFADAVAALTGANPKYILAHAVQARDLEGKIYDKSSYDQYVGSSPKPISEEEMARYLHPVRIFMLAAARIGKTKIVTNFIRRELEHVAALVPMLRAHINAIVQEEATHLTREVTFGTLRANPDLAAFLNFQDDPKRTDTDVAFKTKVTKAPSQEQPTWFDSKYYA
jgi:transcriptional regulator with XRE-family HTH domain